MAFQLSGLSNGVSALRTVTTDPWSWGIGGGTLNDWGVVVSVAHGADTTDYVSSVVLSGESPGTFTRIVRITTAGEPGAAELWAYLPSAPLSTNGSITVIADLTSATGVDIAFKSWRIEATKQLEVIDSDSVQGIIANPSLLMSKAGRPGISFGSFYGGANTPAGTLQSGMFKSDDDLGNFWTSHMNESTGGAADSTDQQVGWSTQASDDVALVAICIAETVSAGVDPPGYRPTATIINPAVPMATRRNR